MLLSGNNQGNYQFFNNQRPLGQFSSFSFSCLIYMTRFGRAEVLNFDEVSFIDLFFYRSYFRNCS